MINIFVVDEAERFVVAPFFDSLDDVADECAFPLVLVFKEGDDCGAGDVGDGLIVVFADFDLGFWPDTVLVGFSGKFEVEFFETCSFRVRNYICFLKRLTRIESSHEDMTVSGMFLVRSVTFHLCFGDSIISNSFSVLVGLTRRLAILSQCKYNLF